MREEHESWLLRGKNVLSNTLNRNMLITWQLSLPLRAANVAHFVTWNVADAMVGDL